MASSEFKQSQSPCTTAQSGARIIDFMSARNRLLCGGTYSFYDMYVSLSTALDLVDPRLGDHHLLTCYIASSLAKELGITGDAYRRVFATSLIHDIGATSLHERLDILNFDFDGAEDHALIGEAVLSCVEPLADLAPEVGDHHVTWDHGRGEVHRGREVSLISHVIQLADRVAVLIDRNNPLILTQADTIRRKIQDKVGKLFEAQLASAFCDMASRSQFWLGMDPTYLQQSIRTLSACEDVFITLDELSDLTNIFAFLIDSRSRFTANHSWGVAVVAEALAQAHGLDETTTTQLKIAGYLHDIGKVSVPSEILEKNGKLSKEDRVVMNGHSFYTEKIIGSVRGLEDISAWSSQHHELIDGTGYPHGLGGSDLSVEARLMTIADIFTALTENRPYRAGMPLHEALKIVADMADKGKIDGDVTKTLIDNADEIDGARRHAQHAENQKLDLLWQRAGTFLDQGRADA